MATVHQGDRLRGFRYVVEIEGVPCAGFGYCAGLADAHAPVGYFIGDDEVDLLDLAMVEHPSYLILAQGVAFDNALDAWQRSRAEGQVERHDGAIVEYDGRGRVRHTYHFHGASPSYFQRSRAAGGVDRQVETLEIVYDSLTRN